MINAAIQSQAPEELTFAICSIPRFLQRRRPPRTQAAHMPPVPAVSVCLAVALIGKPGVLLFQRQEGSYFGPPREGSMQGTRGIYGRPALQTGISSCLQSHLSLCLLVFPNKVRITVINNNTRMAYTCIVPSLSHKFLKELQLSEGN